MPSSTSWPTKWFELESIRSPVAVVAEDSLMFSSCKVTMQIPLLVMCIWSLLIELSVLPPSSAEWMSSYQSHFFFSMLSAAVIQPQGHMGLGKWGFWRNKLPRQKVLQPLWKASLQKWPWKKANERALLIMYGSQIDHLKTARLQKFQTKVATAAGYVPPEKLLPTSDPAWFPPDFTVTVSFCRYNHGKGTIFLLRSGDGQDNQQALFLCRCQNQKPQCSSCETSDVIVVADVIQDLAPASRTAYSALQRAVNVRALHAKTLCKWIMRILMTLLIMISETNDTANNNCYMKLKLL